MSPMVIHMLLFALLITLPIVLVLLLVAYWRHVDEVDNNQAAEVTQAQLTSNLIGSFEVGVKRGFFDIAAAGRACGVDVDGG